MVGRLPAYRLDGEAGNRTSYSPVGAGTGAELGNKPKIRPELNILNTGNAIKGMLFVYISIL